MNGDRLIRLLRDSSGAEPASAAPEDAKASEPSDDKGESNRPSYYWTWLLLDRDFSVEQIAALRGMEEDQVLQEAHAAQRHGLPIKPDSISKPGR